MFVELDKNRKLYYDVVGSGKALIMVHGNGEDSSIFSEAVDKLKQYFKVYTVDSSGHGRSYKLEQYHYDILAQDIYDLIIELDIQKPIFYGFSDGGIIGLLLASKYQDLFSSLVVSGANTYPKGLKYLSYIGMKIEYLFNKSSLVKMMLTEPNITKEDLQKIKCKSYILAGSKDVIRYSHTKAIADSIANSTLKIIPNQTHGSYIVHSTKIADILISMVDNG